MSATPVFSFGTPQYLAVNISTSGDNTLVSGLTVPENQRIVLLSFQLFVASAVVLTWKSGSGTALSGAIGIGGSGQPTAHVGEDATQGWMATNPGDPLVLNLSAGVAVTGFLTYAIE